MKTLRIYTRKIGSLRPRYRLLALGLIVGLLATACGGLPAPSESTTSNPAGSQNSAASQNSVLNTEEFGLTTEELVRSIEEVESLIAQCMSEAGRRSTEPTKRQPSAIDSNATN